MVMKKRKIIWSLIFMIILSCEDRVNLPSSAENVDLIIVDGILTNENINHKIKLTRAYKTQNENPIPVTGAVLRIFEGLEPIPLFEFPTGSGEYYTPKIRAVVRKVYTLRIRYQGQEYFAQDSSVPVEPLPAIDLQKKDGNYMVVESKSGDRANFVTYDVNWSGTEPCLPGTTCAARIVYYDLKTIDVNEIFKPKTADFTFPAKSIIVRKKFSVSDEYKNFLRSMLSETEWRGGVFDVQRENVPTNLSTGATGFFAVSTVISDTTLVK
jgi:hypothetical protein